MRECLGKLNGTSSFLSLVQENINMLSRADTIIGFVPKVAVKNDLIKKIDMRNFSLKQDYLVTRKSKIQNGYRKYGSHARVFSQTF